MEKQINHKLYYYGGFWTIVGTALISHTVLTIPPALLIIGITSLLALILVACGNTRIPVYALITIPFMLYLSVTQPFTSASLRNIVGPIAGAFFFPVVLYYINRLSKKQILTIVHYFITISIIALTFETLYRYIFPPPELVERALWATENNFYMYKMRSLMYSCSNGAAIHMVIILFFTYYWSEYSNKNYKFAKFFLFLIIALTLSRTAWLGTIVGIIYVKFLRNKSTVYWITSGIMVLMLMTLTFFSFIYTIIKDDGSFLSKFEIANSVIEYYKSTFTFKDIFFGVGIYNSDEVLSVGLAAHSFLIQLSIETGFVSLALFILMLFQMGYYSNWKISIILVPFFITTLSATLSFMPCFYVAIALMCFAEKTLINK